MLSTVNGEGVKPGFPPYHVKPDPSATKYRERIDNVLGLKKAMIESFFTFILVFIALRLMSLCGRHCEGIIKKIDKKSGTDISTVMYWPVCCSVYINPFLSPYF